LPSSPTRRSSDLHVVTILLLWLASSRILPIGVRAGALAKYGIAGLAAWAVASRIALASHLLNAASRCAVGIAIYAVALIALDSRARAVPAYLLRSRKPAPGDRRSALAAGTSARATEVVCK